MSNKGKDKGSKKWLISRLKTSGSKKKYVESGDFADDRNSKRRQNWEDLPMREGMSKTFQFFNNRVNYGLLVRFLRGKVGQPWQEVHAEILARIPSNLQAYKDCTKWFVADLVEVKEGQLWDKREQKYLKLDHTSPDDFSRYTYKEFYVNPNSGCLERIIKPSTKYTKTLSSVELRQFREEQQQVERCKTEQQKLALQKAKQTARQLLSQHNQKQNKSEPE